MFAPKTILLSMTLILQAGIAGTPLTAEAPQELSGKAARFDFMEVDASRDLLLAAHKGSSALTVVDLKTQKTLPEVAVGQVQGIAIDGKAGMYILGDEKELKVVLVNAKSVKKVGEIATTGPVDAVAFDSNNGMAYADEDGGNHVWVIDVKSKKIAGEVSLPGEPEAIVYDPASDRLYQNIKTKDSVAVIDPKKNTVEATWPTLPATGPHGIAVDVTAGRIFVAGHNGKLVGIDVKSGKVFAKVDIAPGPDQIAFDPTIRTIYCASKGFISVVKESDSGLELLGNVAAPEGAHTIAVDSVRHEIWISYANKEHSYLQRFKANG